MVFSSARRRVWRVVVSWVLNFGTVVNLGDVKSMDKSERAKKIGRLGEKALDTWASQASITANKAYEDDEGWDFILGFPLQSEFEPGKTLPLDLRPSPLQCLIQVKATDGKSGSRQVKLDNWERLVKRPWPAFFLVCEFDGEDECQRAYLVHIDEPS